MSDFYFAHLIMYEVNLTAVFCCHHICVLPALSVLIYLVEFIFLPSFFYKKICESLKCFVYIFRIIIQLALNLYGFDFHREIIKYLLVYGWNSLINSIMILVVIQRKIITPFPWYSSFITQIYTQQNVSWLLAFYRPRNRTRSVLFINPLIFQFFSPRNKKKTHNFPSKNPHSISTFTFYICAKEKIKITKVKNCFLTISRFNSNIWEFCL